MDIIDKARKFSQEKHKNQFDDAGLDYWTSHILQVVRIVSLVTPDPEMWAAALLHDTLEDTNTTPIELATEFGPRVARLVCELTHEGKKDQGGYYFPNLKSRDAILIKFADRLSNLSRMETWDEKRQNQYLQKSKFWKSDPSQNI